MLTEHKYEKLQKKSRMQMRFVWCENLVINEINSF